MTDNTILRLTGIGIPDYSARGLVQTLEPIGQAKQLVRTVNGELIDISMEQFRKYASTITGDDQEPPAFDMVFPGTVLTVDCIARLAVEVSSDMGTEDGLGRTAVEGSRVTERGFIFYRPRLVMMVTSWSMDEDEWQAGVKWQLGLEEV